MSVSLPALAIGLFVALQISYLHPDEHFQNLEILAIRVFGIKGTVPWEFLPINAARSYVPVYVTFGPIFYILRKSGLEYPMLILSLIRLQNYMVYLLVYRLAVRYFKRTSRFDLNKVEFFISTSYITWTYQSHSFSNSLETILLLIVLSLYSNILWISRNKNSDHFWTSIILGITITLGVFNRITFPAFILLPSISIFWKFYRFHWRSFGLFLLTIACTTFAFICFDTSIYNSPSPVIAPLNNLLYNFDESNLELHGLHPRYNHLLINLPQIVGPAIFLLIPHHRRFKQAWTNLPLLSIISGTLVLSVFKHQELRFLVPLTPLLFMCFNEKAPFKWMRSDIIIKSWIVFNLILGIVMGCYHQSGVLRVLDVFYRQKNPVDVHIWWKTYSPPTWMYMNQELTVSTTNFVDNIERIDEVPLHATTNHIVDLKGCDAHLLNYTLTNFLKNGAKVNLIAPNSVKRHLQLLMDSSNFVVEKKYETKFHLDLDHLDFGDPVSFAPGIAIYEATLKE